MYVFCGVLVVGGLIECYCVVGGDYIVVGEVIVVVFFGWDWLFEVIVLVMRDGYVGVFVVGVVEGDVDVFVVVRDCDDWFIGLCKLFVDVFWFGLGVFLVVGVCEGYIGGEVIELGGIE